VIAALVFFISSQLSMFGEKLPVLQDRFHNLLQEGMTWASSTFPVSREKLGEWVDRTRQELFNNSGSYIGSTLTTMSGVLMNMVLIPIYVFMIIYYEPLFVEFVKRVFPAQNHSQISEMMTESKTAMQHYLIGLMVEMLIVASMNATVLYLIGIEYAVMLGLIGALLNMIPYIGNFIATSLPILMALVTKDSVTPVYLIFLAYCVIQFIDNNILMPRVVASRVKVNAFASVLAVLIGGALWGVPGMFLSIPMLAIIKIICDRIPALQPYGYVLGVQMPEHDNNFFQLWKLKLKRRPGNGEV
jgi:predicted PurR-regulated permease PerM